MAKDLSTNDAVAHRPSSSRELKNTLIQSIDSEPSTRTSNFNAQKARHLHGDGFVSKQRQRATSKHTYKNRKQSELSNPRATRPKKASRARQFPSHGYFRDLNQTLMCNVSRILKEFDQNTNHKYRVKSTESDTPLTLLNSQLLGVQMPFSVLKLRISDFSAVELLKKTMPTLYQKPLNS